MVIKYKSELLFGIVAYKEKYWECASFRSLLASFHLANTGELLRIFVFDNTDEKGWNLATPAVSDNVEINYRHESSNPGISAAYNAIAGYANANSIPWLVFLDQDTSLPENFYQQYFRMIKKSMGCKIAIPKIYSGNGLISPSKYIGYRSYQLSSVTESSLSLKNISVINSGLLIETNFFFECGGYNKNLRLDFCDHDFIERVAKNIKSVAMIPIVLNQDFSFETNSKEKAMIRYKLFYRDLKAYRKSRNKFLLFLTVDLPHVVKETLRHKTISFLKERFRIVGHR